MGLKAKNRLLLREAIALYGRGLELQCGSSAVDAALRNNRAHVHALLGAFGDVFCCFLGLFFL
jgi:hypothetical protein